MLTFDLPATRTLAIDPTLFAPQQAHLTPLLAGLHTPYMTGASLPHTVCYPYLTCHLTVASQDGRAHPAEHLLFTRRSWSLRDPAQVETALKQKPTLRYIKDNAIVDIVIQGMTTEQFLSRRCLQLRTERGLFVLSKRLSRILRPFRYFGFFDTSTVNVVCDPSHDNDSAWDGMSLISPQFVKRFAYTGQWQAQYQDTRLLQQKRRDLLQATRLELTLMTADGQIKGHALVVDGLPAGIDVVTNGQNIKTEISQHDGQTFVGLDIVHGKVSAEIDKQSLINLVPFLDTDWLFDNLQQETETILTDLDSQLPPP